MEEGPDRSEVPSSADVWGRKHCRPRAQPVLRLQARREPGLDADQGDQAGEQEKDQEWRRGQRGHGMEIRAGHRGNDKDHGFLSELWGDLLAGLSDQ